ncbi:MAG: hypothetical protein AUH85_13060 [Chloroflexi bacterium 13_1_40CM_4_68_4]|nr:MAG: hypothetical protein AUH85_13060 [Chloroflexi bacterium 13_1_40CM_4_68_4]
MRSIYTHTPEAATRRFNELVTHWTEHPDAFIGAAARYFGIAESELVDELDAGKTLADVAREHGRTRKGLIAALVRADVRTA